MGKSKNTDKYGKYRKLDNNKKSKKSKKHLPFQDDGRNVNDDFIDK